MANETEDLGELVWLAVAGCLEHIHRSPPAERLARHHWDAVAPYWKRRIISDIEIAIMLSDRDDPDYPRLPNDDVWKRFVAEMAPPKAPYTVCYQCAVCGATGRKLWRAAHVFASQVTLKCASCLAPDLVVGDDGLASDPDDDDPDYRTDQVCGWLPAVPVHDTFWGYTSVPSVDARWWKALPTYAKNE